MWWIITILCKDPWTHSTTIIQPQRDKPSFSIANLIHYHEWKVGTVNQLIRSTGINRFPTKAFKIKFTLCIYKANTSKIGPE